MRKAVLLLAIVSLLAGVGTLAYTYERAENLVVSRPFVVPAVPIPSYTIIYPNMLTEKEFPRTLAGEPLYVQAEDLVGKITTVPLHPDQLVYHSQAVSQASFRFTDDPTLEVLSFPVDPSKSVGGQIRIGQRVYVYRSVSVRPKEMEGITAADLLAQDAAAVEVLAEDVLVVDIRSSQGQRVQEIRPQSEIEAEGLANYDSAGRTIPLQILTVAVPHQVAAELVKLVGEQKAQYDLWVSLAPVGKILVQSSRMQGTNAEGQTLVQSSGEVELVGSAQESSDTALPSTAVDEGND